MEKVNAKCNKCGYTWLTKSKMFLTSCPRCGNKVRLDKRSDDGSRYNGEIDKSIEVYHT